MKPLTLPFRSPVFAKPWVRCPVYFLGCYVGIVSLLCMLENRLIFHPATAEQSWFPAPSPEIQDVRLTLADGTCVHAWWCPCEDSDQAVLYCHGNGGNLSHRGHSVVNLRKLLHASVLIIDYPGYGKSSGRPSEAGCYQSANAAYDWLIHDQKIAPKKLLLYGDSLGGGVIVDLAARKEARGIVLIKTFTSVPNVASDLYWWLPMPVQMMMTNRFDSLSKIRACTAPVFIGHGTADGLIPYAHGERLYQTANAPKAFFCMKGADHDGSLPEEFFVSLKAFLEQHPVP